MEVFQTFEPLLKTFWFVAIPTSLIFVIQTIMTFIGADATDGVNADFDSNLTGTEAPFQLFSLRNLINFLLGFSWTGISFYNTITSPLLLLFVALVVGSLFVFLFFLIISQVQKLAEDNSFRYANTIDKTAEVYLNIPANRQGKGKVLISVNGAIHELDAMTDNERIVAGSVVKVIKIESESILIVEKI
ncbi:MAG: NfeD family protein [Bacteroidales bacterium]|nr:NfeD family protein [Bacteroidales bacterium]